MLDSSKHYSNKMRLFWDYFEIKTQTRFRFHPSERRRVALWVCAEYFCSFIIHSWGVLSSLPSGSLLSALLFFTPPSHSYENIPVFTYVHIGLERNSFHRKKEANMVEVIALLTTSVCSVLATGPSLILLHHQLYSLWFWADDRTSILLCFGCRLWVLPPRPQNICIRLTWDLKLVCEWMVCGPGSIPAS